MGLVDVGCAWDLGNGGIGDTVNLPISFVRFVVELGFAAYVEEKGNINIQRGFKRMCIFE